MKVHMTKITRAPHKTKKIKPLGRKTGMEDTIANKSGGHALFQKLTHVGLAVSVLVSACALQAASAFITSSPREPALLLPQYTAPVINLLD